MKASEIRAKTDEIERFEPYEGCIKKRKEQLEKVQYIICNGVTNGRAINGDASLTVFETGQWGSTLEGEANITHNKLEIKLNTFLSLSLLKAYEKDLIKSIMQTADNMEIEEDRFHEIFDEHLDLEKYKYGGWF